MSGDTYFGVSVSRSLGNGPHVSIWGDGSPGTSLVSFRRHRRFYTVYGRIPARQNVPAGTYGDTITVTLTF